MGTIRDMLSVGTDSHGRWAIYFWGGGDPSVLGHFSHEDEAWGVVSLILEYVEQHDFAFDRAIWQAMIEYAEALAGEASDTPPTPDELGRMAHAHAMGYVS